MSFMDAISTCLSKYTDFNGRAARSEFWYFILFSILVQLAIAIVLGGLPRVASIVSGLVSLGLLLPSIAVATRRLHDTGRSGWWQLIMFVPVIGTIVLIVFWCLQGEERTNEYGSPVVAVA